MLHCSLSVKLKHSVLYNTFKMTKFDSPKQSALDTRASLSSPIGSLCPSNLFNTDMICAYLRNKMETPPGVADM